MFDRHYEQWKQFNNLAKIASKAFTIPNTQALSNTIQHVSRLNTGFLSESIGYKSNVLKNMSQLHNVSGLQKSIRYNLKGIQEFSFINKSFMDSGVTAFVNYSYSNKYSNYLSGIGSLLTKYADEYTINEADQLADKYITDYDSYSDEINKNMYEITTSTKDEINNKIKVDKEKLKAYIATITTYLSIILTVISILTSNISHYQKNISLEVNNITVTNNFYYGADRRTKDKIINKEFDNNQYPDLILTNFRYVSSPGLLVFQSQSKKSNVKGQLRHGEVVLVMEKKRNWSKVRYENVESGLVVEGWTYTRYLKKLNRN